MFKNLTQTALTMTARIDMTGYVSTKAVQVRNVIRIRCNYLKGNPPKVVHTYKEFCFNIADVCLTPYIKIDWANKVCFFTVTTAQSDNGRWMV